MNKRVEGLKRAQSWVNTAAARVDEVYDNVQGFLHGMNMNLEEQIDEAVANAAVYEEAERRAQEVIDKFKAFKTNPQVKTFWESFVTPAKGPDGPVNDKVQQFLKDTFSEFTDKVDNEGVLTRAEKIAACKEFYKTNYGMDIWANGDPSDDTVDNLYRTVVAAQ